MAKKMIDDQQTTSGTSQPVDAAPVSQPVAEPPKPKTPKIQAYDIQGQSWQDVKVPGLEVIENAKLSPRIQSMVEEGKKRGPSGLPRGWTKPNNELDRNSEEFQTQLKNFKGAITADLERLTKDDIDPEVRNIISVMLQNPNTAARMIHDTDLKGVPQVMRQEMKEKLFDLKDKLMYYRKEYKEPYDETFNRWMNYSKNPVVPNNRPPKTLPTEEAKGSGLENLDKLNANLDRIKSSKNFIHTLMKENGMRLSQKEKDYYSGVVANAWKRAWMGQGKGKKFLPRTKESWDETRGMIISTLEDLDKKKTRYAYDIFGDYVKNSYAYITLNNLNRIQPSYYNQLLKEYDGDYEGLRDDVTRMLCDGKDPMELASSDIPSTTDFRMMWNKFNDDATQHIIDEERVRRETAAVANMNAGKKGGRKKKTTEQGTASSITPTAAAPTSTNIAPAAGNGGTNGGVKNNVTLGNTESLKTYMMDRLMPLRTDKEDKKEWNLLMKDPEFMDAYNTINKILRETSQAKIDGTFTPEMEKNYNREWQNANKVFSNKLRETYGLDKIKKKLRIANTQPVFPRYRELLSVNELWGGSTGEDDENADVKIEVSAPPVNDVPVTDEDDDDEDIDENNLLFGRRMNDGNGNSEGMSVEEKLKDAEENVPNTVGFTPPSNIKTTTDLDAALLKIPGPYGKMLSSDLIREHGISMMTVISNWDKIIDDPNTPDWLKNIKDPNELKDWAKKHWYAR